MKLRRYALFHTTISRYSRSGWSCRSKTSLVAICRMSDFALRRTLPSQFAPKAATAADERSRLPVEGEREVAVGAGARGPAPIADDGRGVAKPVCHHTDALPSATARLEQGRVEDHPRTPHVHDA